MYLYVHCEIIFLYLFMILCFKGWHPGTDGLHKSPGCGSPQKYRTDGPPQTCPLSTWTTSNLPAINMDLSLKNYNSIWVSVENVPDILF